MTESGSSIGAGGWRIAIVEDHLLQRLRTEELLGGERAFRIVHSAESLPDFMKWLSERHPGEYPHLLVLDLVVDRGPNVDPDVVEALVRAGVRVLVLSAMASPPLVREVLRAGVAGIVGKRDSERDIVSAAWSVLGSQRWMTPELASVIAGDADRPHLSDQEERALVLYASGLTLAAVADSLGVKPDTVKTYLERVKTKYAELGRTVRTKVDLSRAAIVDGYLAPDAGPATAGDDPDQP